MAVSGKGTDGLYTAALAMAREGIVDQQPDPEPADANDEGQQPPPPPPP